MVTNPSAKYETRILQEQRIQNTKANLNWSWLFLKDRFTDEQKILLTHLHLQYGSYVGTSIESICDSLQIQIITSQVEAVVTKALIKADKFYFISNFRLPVDCFVRSFSHFYNLELPIPARIGSLYFQSLIPPYIMDLWVPEDLLDNYYKNYLIKYKLIIKDLYGFRLLI